MPDLKISELPEITTPSDTNTAVVVSGGVTSRIAQRLLRGIPSVADESGVTIVNHEYDVGHLYRYGTNTTPGTTDMTTALNAAISVLDGNGGELILPADAMYFNTSSIEIATGRFTIRGESQRLSRIIVGTAVTGSFFDLTGSVTFLHMRDFRMEGTSANGHAINLIDPAIGSGPEVPQGCTFKRLTIDGFSGTDIEGAGSSFGACGIIQHDGLNNTYENLNISNCGQGMYLRLTENCKINHCTVSACEFGGIVDYDNESLTINDCDVINCGDGASRTVPEAVENFNILSMRSHSTTIEYCYTKNVAGLAAIGFELTEGITIRENWIRGDSTANGDHKGIYGERNTNYCIEKNTFSPSVSGFTGDYQHIELYHTQVVEPSAGGKVRDNVFFVVGQDTDYCVLVTGNGSGRLHTNLEITGNTLGQRASVSTNTVTDFIRIDSNAAVNGLVMENNGVVATTNTTVTNCLNISATVTGRRIRGNKSHTNGGTVTNDWSAYDEDGVVTFADSDATPSVMFGNVFETGTVTDTITDFDDGVAGQEITVISAAAITYDTTGTNLSGSSADIVTASGDVTRWVMDSDGTTWRLIAFVDASVDNSGGA